MMQPGEKLVMPSKVVTKLAESLSKVVEEKISIFRLKSSAFPTGKRKLRKWWLKVLTTSR